MSSLHKTKGYLQRIREPNKRIPMSVKLSVSAALLLIGAGLGVLQKWLDSLAVNELPQLLQRLDITNYFGRLAVWIFLGTVIAVYAATPLRAALNNFLFFIGMVAGYYIYCHAVLGFLPRSYMMIWLVLACVCPVIAFVCWYARGEGIIAIVISGGILGVLFAQAFFLLQGFRVTHALEVVTWLAALPVLRRKPKEFALELGIALAVAVVFQLCIPYWG